MNQCSHNLDLLQWICGMPVRVQCLCKEGHFHDIEVEDDVRNIAGGGTDCLRERKTANITLEQEEKQYEKVLQGFADERMGVGKCIAPGTEGRKNLLLSNAAYLPSWEKGMVDIPNIGTDEELEIERLFEKWLKQKRCR